MIVSGALVLVFSFRYRNSDAPRAASMNPADWKMSGILGLKAFTPRGQKFQLAGWVLFLLGVIISLSRYFAS